MEYTESFFKLRSIFNGMENKTAFEDAVEMVRLPFNSESHWQPIMDDFVVNTDDRLGIDVPDSKYFENNHFHYPVFIPVKQKVQNKAIILLHGLNERSWDKYLPWAYFLAQKTGKPVILFPIAFHINRAPAHWNNAKSMALLMDYRKQNFQTNSLTYANVALSTRLTEQPLRFLRSGLQTAEDLMLLIKQLEEGLVPGFGRGTKIDILAYSIGAFISQILLLAYPTKFSDTRLFQFCGGSLFADMNGISRLIMDSLAFERINRYYVHDIHKTLSNFSLFRSLITEFPFGRAFFTMLREENNKKEREEIFHSMANRICTLTLKKDTVITPSGTRKAFGEYESEMVNTIDLPYDYCHEMPFPVSGKTDHAMVDKYFKAIFSEIADFLA